ncbi:electron transport complex subunit RsxG [Billgrantia endophytica]|uniref:Ion-translocating oxidoreductase complex subunit G n=1 Tax=Billgrantia endophytica TaxID=2033802 RepID=A0A2N7U018_9GAMM|nr:electron transport complex subunit RsxG [Halomonas endophytica]PMR73778.1 electron transport complex subunit RsxG [Halomonas endophytica]
MSSTSRTTHGPDDSTDERSWLERWRTRVAYQGLFLGLTCALVTLLLLVGDRLTAETIAIKRHADQVAMLRQVLPTELYDNDPLGEAFIVEDVELGEVEVYPAMLDGGLSAVVLQLSPGGYAGPIDLLISVDSGGHVLGVRVLAHKETPGLADDIEVARSDWIKSFDGLSLGNPPLAGWAVTKDGGQFEYFTGATITPRAIVKAVLHALQFQIRNADQLAQREVQSSEQREIQP